MEIIWILFWGGLYMDQLHFDMQWPRDNLYLSCFSHEVMNYRYHWHPDEYELGILLHGTQEFCCNTETNVFQEDDIVLIDPGSGHASFSREANTCALVLHFSADAFKQFLKKETRFSFHNCHTTTETRDAIPYRWLRFYAAQILDAAIQGGPYAQLTAKASMEMILSILCRHFQPEAVRSLPEQDEQHARLVHRLLNYIDQHYNEKLSLEELSQFAQYNRTYISTLFKNTVGVNFYEYLTRVRFQNALIELATTDKNLTEIALDNGFSDLKSFNKRFRETLHRSPSEYRAQLLPGHVLGDSTRRYLTSSDVLVQKKLKEYLNWSKERA